ncbi:hypothetical protein D0809_08455 [Flavobacterium circumlabens]|uniref:Lipoprotein n=1 Tax=Flavobacterium circumlabens TaxID=2133765 RepID=A0A4Y7UG64_9FLAO|nr:hypothetical protein [Flavobacterium circumlabens]TCN59946.1 hypothetical protein EV142_102566 [Flavobacterium circumlabens]TEB45191.1 hypothetical protein D0809_08455 [Flavobacterium circumlabens]
MNAKILLPLLTAFFLSCNSYEKLGDFKYRTTIDRVFNDDFGGVIISIKTYYSPTKDTFLFGNKFKIQKLDFEGENDTNYINGKFKYDPVNKTITTTQIFKNGYERFLEVDSLVRVFVQKIDGSVVLKEYIEYKDGIGRSE